MVFSFRRMIKHTGLKIRWMKRYQFFEPWLDNLLNGECHWFTVYGWMEGSDGWRLCQQPRHARQQPHHPDPRGFWYCWESSADRTQGTEVSYKIDARVNDGDSLGECIVITSTNSTLNATETILRTWLRKPEKVRLRAPCIQRKRIETAYWPILKTNKLRPGWVEDEYVPIYVVFFIANKNIDRWKLKI